MRRATVRRLLVPISFAIFAVGCGAGQPIDAQAVRRSFSKLQSALDSQDAQTICRLLAPIGQASSLAVLQAGMPQLQRMSRQQLQGEIEDCARSLRPSDIEPLKRGLTGLSLRTVALVHDHDLATARAVSAGRSLNLIFVKLAGEWRLAFGNR